MKAPENRARIERVPLDRMIKDDDAQRPFDLAWGKWLAQNFDSSLVGVLHVSERPDGIYAVTDGWHRRHALLANGYTHAPCLVGRGLSIQAEAAQFAGLNKQRKVKFFDGFVVRVTAGEPMPVSIAAACEAAGWKLGRSGADGNIGAMQALERIYKLRAEPQESRALIDRVLQVVTDAWGFNTDAVNATVLLGVAFTLARYEAEIEPAALSTKLAKYAGGAGGLLGAARGLHSIYKSSLANCAAEIVVNTYNVGRTTHRIADWRR